MEILRNFTTQYMNYLILALPILIGILNAKRYNIFYGIISTFTSAYFISFLFLESTWISKEFISSIPNLEEGILYMDSILVSPVKTLIFQGIERLNVESFQEWFYSNTWFYFAFMIIIATVLFFWAETSRKNREYPHGYERRYC